MTESTDTSVRFPASSGPLSLPGPAGLLECLIELPEQEQRSGTAIICHPHPLHGGTMHNKVVTMVSRSLVELGLSTVRFNFRGVGNSQGEYDDGNGETEDLRAIADWLRRERPGDATERAAERAHVRARRRCARARPSSIPICRAAGRARARG